MRVLTPTESQTFYDNHGDATGAEPAEDKRWTDNQMSVMHDRAVTSGEDPYADFSVLTPCGRRVAQHL